MKHINIKKHKTAAIGTGIGIVALVFILGYGVINNQKNNANADQVKNELIRINGYKKNFKGDSDSLLKALKNLEAKYQAYLSSDSTKKDGKINYKFVTLIAKEKKYFENKTNSTIKENTSIKLSKENKDTLQSKVTNLDKELKDIESKKGVAFTSKQVNRYSKKINKLLDQYNLKLENLSKTEDEKASSESIAAASSLNAASSSASASSLAVAQATSQSSNTTVTVDSTASSTTETAATRTYSGASNGTSTYRAKSTSNARATSSTIQAASPTTTNSGSTDAKSKTTYWDAGKTSSTMHYVGKEIQINDSTQASTNQGDNFGWENK
ncbi:hypothetical protein [Liquorilactobacillus hordei]|uniref:Uncharacterized protein n=1 Tax=Liquorilactobacillus hordei TaxID=468911 RepID=A0A3S6QPB5_9LACO|nr:hypothetical protein [Liquorilactobacillus hordei]AUJ29813.1 hypothetical protein BSQ49_06185 [Liquorilactobacillus hordei]